jgi:hypothetical protein
MNIRHQLITLAAGGTMIVAVLTGCAASPVRGSGGFQSAPIAAGAPGSAGPRSAAAGSGALGSGAVAPHAASATSDRSTKGSTDPAGPTASPEPNVGPSGIPPGAISRVGPPTDLPSAIPVATVSGFSYTDDYSVRATGNCWWEMNDGQQLYLAAQFTVSYAGPDPATIIPYAATIGDGSGTGNTQHGAAYGTATFNVRAGGESRTSSSWPGTTVPLTMRLEPTSDDSNAADNVATVRLVIPTPTPQIDLLTPVSC